MCEIQETLKLYALGLAEEENKNAVPHTDTDTRATGFVLDTSSARGLGGPGNGVSPMGIFPRNSATRGEGRT